MKQAQRIDVHGLSIQADGPGGGRDHFAVGTLNKSMRLHQSSLSIDDDSRVHGHNQGHVFVVATGTDARRSAGFAVDHMLRYFLDEMPWHHLEDDVAEVEEALERALRDCGGAFEGGERLGDRAMTLAFVFWPDLYVAQLGPAGCYLGRQRSLAALEAPGEGTRGPSVRHVRLRPGDVLALVTAGTAEALDRERLATLLRRDEPAEGLCGHVLAAAEGRAGDRTAVVVRFLPQERPGVAASGGPLQPLAARRDVPRAEHGTPERVWPAFQAPRIAAAPVFP
jgi:protein phosphatase